MDFPVFHLDFLGDRLLIAIIAILHVLINHGLAVGLIPVVVCMELFGLKYPGWDELAYKILKVAFIITTTIGALTGVGIWLSSSLINPYSIGSLIRVFYWAWFTEWIVFVTEVILIMWYFLSWKKKIGSDVKSLVQKGRHVLIGYSLSVFSWITMAIIVAILGYMMDPGNWNNDRTLWNGFTNPIYVPQLAFRTFLAFTTGGVVALCLTMFFTEKDSDIRKKAVRFLGRWIFIFTPFALAAGYWYYTVIPDGMVNNMSVAVGTQQFQNYYDSLTTFLVVAFGGVLIITGFAYYAPSFTPPKWAFVIPVLLMFGLLGYYERVREFIRKPYVIGGYMYSNTFRVEDYPLLQRDGILKHSNFVSTTEVTESNKIEAGKNVFLLACSRCHTTGGVNSLTEKFDDMYGNTGEAWNAAAMKAYISNMHNSRYFMPPFPGNEKELDALIAYLKELQFNPVPVDGAQTSGIQLPENNTEYFSENLK
jgi:cytochrome c2